MRRQGLPQERGGLIDAGQIEAMGGNPARPGRAEETGAGRDAWMDRQGVAGVAGHPQPAGDLAGWKSLSPMGRQQLGRGEAGRVRERAERLLGGITIDKSQSRLSLARHTRFIAARKSVASTTTGCY